MTNATSVDIDPAGSAIVSGEARPDDDLNAFCTDDNIRLDPKTAGPLSGMSFGVKDVFAIEGTKIGFGHPDWRRTHPVESGTANLVSSLLESGATMVGKTISDELCYSLSGINYHYGTPRNVNAPGRIAGGSSSGSAAAVAAGVCDFALGTDCGGSIRLPASYCGIYGIRPSHDRLSKAGLVPFAPSFDVPGWFASDPAVLARVGDVLFEVASQIRPPKGRIHFIEDGFRMLGDDVRESFQHHRSSLTAMFDTSSSQIFGEDELARWRQVFQTIQAHEIWTHLGGWITETRPQFGPGVRERLENASKISDVDAAAAALARREIRSRIDDLLAAGDVLCLPTAPNFAPLVNAPNDLVELAIRNRAMSLLCISGLTGFPQVSIPLKMRYCPPMSLSLIGRWGDDEYLLSLAAQVTEVFKARARL